MLSLLQLSPVALAALRTVVVLLLGVAAVGLGGPLVAAVFRRVDREATLAAQRSVDSARSGAPGMDPPPPGHGGAAALAPPQGVIAAGRHLRGGTWIGMLERLAIYSALLLHFPEGIAICLAIKGLARYPELQATTTGAAERFIIGTFVSVLLACACGCLALWLCGATVLGALG